MSSNKITLDISNLDWNALLADWSWQLKKNYSPLLMTAFGDMFLCDEEGCVDFLKDKILSFHHPTQHLTLVRVFRSADEFHPQFFQHID